MSSMFRLRPASAVEVMRNYKNLGEIYDAAFKVAWKFGASEVEKPDFDCDNVEDLAS